MKEVDNGEKKLHTQRIGKSSSVEEMIMEMNSQLTICACCIKHDLQACLSRVIALRYSENAC
jgi:hypothetical protein